MTKSNEASADSEAVGRSTSNTEGINHTPTQWSLRHIRSDVDFPMPDGSTYHRADIVNDKGEIVATDLDCSEANAHHIVLCVNNHAKLVELLKMVDDTFDREDVFLPSDKKKIKETLTNLKEDR